MSAECLTRLLAQLKNVRAEIVDQTAFIRAELAAVEAEMAVKDLEKVRARLTALEKRVRLELKWEPEHLIEVQYQLHHFVVRDASHDLKNTLWTVVRKLSGASSQDLAADQPLAQSLHLSFELCRNLLRLIETPEIAREKQTFVSIRSLFSDVRLMFSDVSDKIHLIVPAVPKEYAVYGSPYQLMRMIGNLIVNAIEAMPEGGSILLLAEPLGAGTSFLTSNLKEENLLGIRVVDDGPGMTTEQVSRIFTPTDELTDNGGVNRRGVGLASVTTIVTDHKGVFQVDSEVGKGTVMTAVLPHTPFDFSLTESMKRQVAEGEEKLKAAKESGHESVIVIVDDDHSVTRLTSTLLGKLGVAAVSFKTSAAAVAFVTANEPSIRAVILDQILDDHSTFDSNVEDFRASKFRGPILCSSANDPPRGVDIQGEVPKPVDIVALKQVLATSAPWPRLDQVRKPGGPAPAPTEASPESPAHSSETAAE